MLTAYRAERELEHAHFADLPQLLAPGDLVAINTSRTLPASLGARDAASGALQVLHLSTPAPGEPGRHRREPPLDRGAPQPRRGAAAGTPASGSSCPVARAELLAAHLGSRLWVAELDSASRCSTT